MNAIIRTAAAAATTIFILSGCTAQPTTVTPETQENGQKTAVEKTAPDSAKKTYAFEKYGLSLQYPSDWTVEKGYNEEGVIIKAPDMPNVEHEGLISFHPDLGDSDIGIGYKSISTKDYTNPNGIEFSINIMEEDAEFAKNFREPAIANPNYVYILFSTDALPGTHVFDYDKTVNPDGEKQFMEILDSLKKTQ